MEDKEYNDFKKMIADYHKRGYRCFRGESIENYDRETGEHFYRIEIDFTKKTKCPDYFK